MPYVSVTKNNELNMCCSCAQNSRSLVSVPS